MKSTAALSALILGLIATPSVFGQLRIGLTGAINATYMHDRSGSLDAKHTSRGVFGLSAEYGLSKRIAVLTRAMISQKGGRLLDEQGHASSIGLDPTTGEPAAIYDTLTLDSDYRLDYVELPLLLKYKVLTGTLRSYVAAGPWLSINIGAAVHRRTRITRNYVTDTGLRRDDFELQPDAQNIKNSIGRLDAGIVAGLGVETTLSKIDWFVAIEYVHGKKNIVEEPLTFGTSDLANRGLYVLTGMTIPIGQRQ